MRILHAPENVGGMAGTLARAQAALGHRARAYCPNYNKYQYRSDYSMGAPSLVSKLVAAIRFGVEFEVFHFHFGRSLLGRFLLDVLPLSLLGKKIFFYFHGCDIRDEKVCTLQHPISACAECFPKSCSRNREKARAVAERFGRVNFVSTPDLLEFLPRAELLLQAVDFQGIEEVLAEPEPRRDPNRFLIAHAPTHRQIKGTRYLLDCVERLRARGYAIDLRLIEDKTHAEALRVYRAADLAVDQLLIGSYGLVSAEMMALGVPTLNYVRPDLLRLYPEPPPLIDAHPGNLERVLMRCYERRDELERPRQAGRVYARAFHHPLQLARRCLEAYQQ